MCLEPACPVGAIKKKSIAAKQQHKKLLIYNCFVFSLSLCLSPHFNTSALKALFFAMYDGQF